MAVEATFVQGDTAPAITAQIHDEDDPTVPVNLTGCTVRMQMRKADDQIDTVDAPAEITNPTQGLVSYSWGVTDLAIPGDYEVQWEITYVDAKIQTTAVTNKITVRRQ